MINHQNNVMQIVFQWVITTPMKNQRVYLLIKLTDFLRLEFDIWGKTRHLQLQSPHFSTQQLRIFIAFNHFPWSLCFILISKRLEVNPSNSASGAVLLANRTATLFWIRTVLKPLLQAISIIAKHINNQNLTINLKRKTTKMTN